MNDFQAVVLHCRARQDANEEISDACARTIGALYLEGGESETVAFSSTGVIPADPMELWHALFDGYDTMSEDERFVADMMGTYLLNRDPAPPEGWSGLWVR